MNANPKFLAATAEVDADAIAPLPMSSKVYVTGSRADIRVPMREIRQSDTPAGMGAEPNPPIFVYDTSGPYTDPQVRIDIRKGLAALRAPWIEERADTEVLTGPSSAYGRERLADSRLAELRFDLAREPRRAKAGANVTQMHYARTGLIPPQMESHARLATLPRQESLHSLTASVPTGPPIDDTTRPQHPSDAFSPGAPP